MKSLTFTALAMACLGAAMVLFEVLLTRILAIALFPNVAFLAIAVALLGMGAGGWLASIHEKSAAKVGWRRARRAVVVGAVAVLIAVLLTSVLSLVPETLDFHGQDAVSWGQRWRSVRGNYGVLNWPSIVIAIAAQTIPFFCGAYAEAVVFTRNPNGAGWIYAADLAGACAGAWSALVLLPIFGALNGVAVCTLLFLLPVFLLEQRPTRTLRIAAGVVGALAAVVLVVRPLHVRHPAGYNEARVVDVDWSALTRISLYEARNLGSRKQVTTAPADLSDPWLLVDNTSRTQMAFLGDRKYDRNLDRMVTALRPAGDVLIIGAGGGQEILDAHETAAGSGRRIDAVEVAAGIPRMMRKHFSARPGFLLDLPDLRYIVADGRSFVETAHSRWSVIQMKEVNFHTLAGQESVAWSPSLLFTVEAFRAYLRHLTDDGLLSIVKFSSGKGLGTLHLLTTLRQAADEEGYPLGPRLIIIDRPFAYGRRRLLLVCRRPFTQVELLDIRTRAARLHYQILRAPDAPASQLFEEVISGDPDQARELAVHQERMLLEPTRDDRPFGHQHVGYLTALWTGQATESPDVLMQSANFRALTMIIALLLAVCLVVTVAFVRTAERPWRKPAERLLVFAFLGVGFMLLEIVLIERASIWLGHPTVAFITVLTAMLLALGTGSLLSNRWPADSLPRPLQLCVGIAPVACVLLLPRALEWIAPQLATHSRAVNVVAIAVWVWLASIPLGWMLPTMLRVVGRERSLPVASGWALNGLASVLGTVTAALLVRTLGFDTTAWVAVAIYAVAAAGWLRAVSSSAPAPA